MVAVDMEMDMTTGGGGDGGSLDGGGLVFLNTATTIDPSVVTSRIRFSESLTREEYERGNGEELDHNNNNNSELQQQQPHFPQLSALQASGNRTEYRRVRCPPHRYTPLREHWEQILTPLVEHLKLQVGWGKKERKKCDVMAMTRLQTNVTRK